jgi:hypothetical protein
VKKKKALYALGVLIFLGAGLGVFIMAADEQSILSSGLPSAERVRIQDLTTRSSDQNQHIELTDFYFAKRYIYAAKLVQFQDVYVPVFPNGQPENGSNLKVLIWIRNDRNSNEPLIQSERDLDQLVVDFNRRRTSVSGVLRKPLNRVRALTADIYPGVNPESLQVLWARNFPTHQAVDILWSICILCLVAAMVSALAYRRQSR